MQHRWGGAFGGQQTGIFPQAVLSSILLQHLEAGQNDKSVTCLLSCPSDRWQKALVCELGCEFICRSLNSVLLCMGSLSSARKEAFGSEVERRREKDTACKLGSASVPLHLLCSDRGWGITPGSAELLWEHLLSCHCNSSLNVQCRARSGYLLNSVCLISECLGFRELKRHEGLHRSWGWTVGQR